MIKNNRNNEQIYGRNDMIMLDPNNKIYGSLGIADKYVMKTEEGTRLVLKNPKSGKFGDVLTEFNMYGKSEQKQYSGKNLLKIRDGVQTERGVTVTVNDGVVALKGTATETGWSTFKIDSFTLNGTYILSSNLTDATIRLANKSYKAVISQNESKTLENEEVSVLCFVVKEGKTYDISNILVQIEKGTEATPYEPYVGGQPSPSPDYPQEIKSVGDSGSIELNVMGANVLEGTKLGVKSTVNGITYTTYENGILITGTATKTFNISLHEDLKHRLTRGVYYLTTSGLSPSTALNFFYIGKFSSDVQNLEVTLTGDVEYSLLLQILEGATLNTTVQVSLMKSKITSYEPYQEEQFIILPNPNGLPGIPVTSGGNYTDKNRQQWVCDEVDLERGVKMQRIKVKELKPTDKWTHTKLNSGNNNFQTRLLSADVAVDGKPCFCNILLFKNVLWNDNIQNLPKIYANNQEITASFPPSSEYSSVEAFKQLLTNVKSVIYYILATPIETPLTDDEIAAYKALSTKIPTTIIENNYSTWMKATYKSTESV